MGAWSSKPFGNDTALDWLADLEREGDLTAFIAETLEKIGGDWSGDSDDAEEAIAAIAFVAASAAEPIGPTSQEVKKIIVLRGYVPSKELVAISLQALQRISTRSELRDLWEENDGLKSWLSQLEKLSVSLQGSAATSLPARVPKKPGVPRSLCKLLEYYSAEPSDVIRNKIKQKVASVDANEATAETSWDSPLSLISKYGLLDEVQDLLSRGANINTSTPDPFVAACTGGHVQVAELLRQHGAKVFAKVEQPIAQGEGDFLGDIIHRQYRIRGIEPKPPGYEYCLALFAVAREGQQRGAEYLLGLGADLRQTDLNDENLLHKASESGNVEMLRFLIAAGLDPSRSKGKFAESPLHYAVRSRKLEAVSVLLESGANPNHIDKFEGVENSWYLTPLDICEDAKINQLLRRFNGKTASELMSVSGG